MQGTANGVLFALKPEGYDAYTLDDAQGFKDKASLQFIGIFNKYSHRV